MGETLTLNLPDEVASRFRRGAEAARKDLSQFVVERLADTPLPVAVEAESPFGAELAALEALDDEDLWQVARSRLSPGRQRQYTRPLNKSSEGTITPAEEERLDAFTEEVRILTLRKAHAYMLLKWRGHTIPTVAELQGTR